MFIRRAIASAKSKVNRVNPILSPGDVHNPENYFLLPVRKCQPARFESKDLEEFNAYCEPPLNPFSDDYTPIRDTRSYGSPGKTNMSPLTFDSVPHARSSREGGTMGEITSSTINYRLDELQAMDFIDGGPALEDIRHDGTGMRPAQFCAVKDFHDAMIQLLEHGIVPLNQERVLHYDIKPDNVVYNGGTNPVRLIDWDRAVRLTPDNVQSVIRNMTMFMPLLQQPIAYALLSVPAATVLAAAYTDRYSMDDVFLALFRSMQNPGFHLAAELKAEEYAELPPIAANESSADLEGQLTAILKNFYNDVTFTFDWNGYMTLLCHNYDVYGWLNVLNFCWDTFNTLFTEANYYSFPSEPTAKAFLRKYMYSPEILAEPYNIANIITELREIVVPKRGKEMLVLITKQTREDAALRVAAAELRTPGRAALLAEQRDSCKQIDKMQKLARIRAASRNF